MRMDKRIKTLQVRFSEQEWQYLKTLEERSGLNKSKLVRDHLGKIRIRNRDDEKNRVAMLNRINANLNMIARWVNTYKGGADSVEVVSHLMAIERAIDEVAG